MPLPGGEGEAQRKSDAHDKLKFGNIVTKCKRCGKVFKKSGEAYRTHLRLASCKLNTFGRKDQHLLWTGSKFEKRAFIARHIPKCVRSVVSPFFGAGAVELYLLRERKLLNSVRAFDADRALITFWRQMQVSPEELAKELENMIPDDHLVSRDEFQQFVEVLRCSSDLCETEPCQLAACFWALNRLVFNGSMTAQTYVPAKAAILHKRRDHFLAHLKSFEMFPRKKDGKCRLSLQLSDCFDTIQTSPIDALIFADPPYFTTSKSKQYAVCSNWGIEEHTRLRDLLVTKQRWILCHHDCKEIRELYQDFRVIEYSEFAPIISKGKELYRQELLILSEWVAAFRPVEAVATPLQSLPQPCLNACPRNEARAFWTWRCPKRGCDHEVTAWTDSTEWRNGRLKHLKQEHVEFCMVPCPNKCQDRCAICIPEFLLADSSAPHSQIAVAGQRSNLPPLDAHKTEQRALWTWTCPKKGCAHELKAWTDSPDWKGGRLLHLKMEHPDYCIVPCPSRCKNGCSECVASFLLEDSAQPANQTALAPTRSAPDVTPAAAGAPFSVKIWCCPVPSCSHATHVESGTELWQHALSSHLKEAHPRWCIAPCPRDCTSGCPCCVPVGLLEDSTRCIDCTMGGHGPPPLVPAKRPRRSTGSFYS